MEKWQGRVALVTGASSGIGEAICENLVKNGMKVVGAARRINNMQMMTYTALFDKIKETFGGVDVCINNAGFFGTGLNLLSGTPEEWRQMTNVNVIALCLCSKLTVNSLKERGLDDGHIINISSLAGHKVYPFGESHFYTGTKHAVQALSEGLRQELQADNSGIKLSVVSPGLVKTEVFNHIHGSSMYDKIYEGNTSLKSEDIADLVSQILSAPPYMEVLDIIVAPRGRFSLE
ncbi:putative oxidoreductase [Armadillidium vulgare]|nr:putative oxidoreductase [Armadillidium vulgare]